MLSCQFLEEPYTIANKIGGMMPILLLFHILIAIITAKFIKDFIKLGKLQKVRLPLTSKLMQKDTLHPKSLLQAILQVEPWLTIAQLICLVMIITIQYTLLVNQESEMINSFNGSKIYIHITIIELLMDKTQYHIFLQFLMAFYILTLKFSIKIIQLLKSFAQETKIDIALINGNFLIQNILMIICGI